MMKAFGIFMLVLLISCSGNDGQEKMKRQEQDIKRIEAKVKNFHDQIGILCNGGKVNLDSLLESYYTQDVRYVTAWAKVETYDSLRIRMMNSAKVLSQFEYKIEQLEVRSYSEGAFASFILRQSYVVDGKYPLEEYLPTCYLLEKKSNDWRIVFVQRTTNYPTMVQYMDMQIERQAAIEKQDPVKTKK